MWKLWQKKQQSETITTLPEMSYRIKEKLWESGKSNYKLEVKKDDGEWQSLTSYQWIDIRGARREKERLEEVERFRLSMGGCRGSPDKVFVFGDNLIKKGKGGQAIIRGEANAFGVPTKRLPSMKEGSFFSDKEEERQAVLSALRELYCLGKTKTLVMPKDGIGTGRAMMKERSPLLWTEMCSILEEHFNYKNEE